MKRTYEIRPHPDESGGGWKLILLEDGLEAGDKIFQIPQEDPHDVIVWWNGLTGKRRTHWLMMAASAIPSAARHAYLLAQAYNDALEEAESWHT